MILRIAPTPPRRLTSARDGCSRSGRGRAPPPRDGEAGVRGTEVPEERARLPRARPSVISGASSVRSAKSIPICLGRPDRSRPSLVEPARIRAPAGRRAAPSEACGAAGGRGPGGRRRPHPRLRHLGAGGSPGGRRRGQILIPSWRMVYNSPDNADFRRRRPNPNLIQPGDVLILPDLPATTPPAGRLLLPWNFASKFELPQTVFLDPIPRPSLLTVGPQLFPPSPPAFNFGSPGSPGSRVTLGGPFTTIRLRRMANRSMAVTVKR